jgi:hypothetical protein
MGIYLSKKFWINLSPKFDSYFDAAIPEKYDRLWCLILTFHSLRYLLSVKLVCMNIIWLLRKDGQKSEEEIKRLS